MAIRFNLTMQDAFFDECEKLAANDHGDGELGELKAGGKKIKRPGAIKTNEDKNPKLNRAVEIAKDVGVMAAGYTIGFGAGQGLSKLIPKGHPAASKVVGATLPLIGVIGAEFTRKYRDKLDKEVWKTKEA